MMRVVLDTNIWISGLLWNGLPTQILNLAKNQKITIFISEEILIEITKNLSCLCQFSLVEASQLRDSDDIIIISTAISAQAQAIITGDLDLLTLGEFQGIPILTCADFLEPYFN